MAHEFAYGVVRIQMTDEAYDIFMAGGEAAAQAAANLMRENWEMKVKLQSLSSAAGRLQEQVEQVQSALLTAQHDIEDRGQ